MVDNECAEAKAAAQKGAATHDPCYKLRPLFVILNTMFLPVVNCAMRVAVDEITMLSFVYGPAALMKRTPGKKTSQGFQSIAMCSKYVIMGIGLSFFASVSMGFITKWRAFDRSRHVTDDESSS